MTTYLLAVLTKGQKEITETHKVEEVQVVEASAVERNMAPVDLWRGARSVVSLFLFTGDFLVSGCIIFISTFGNCVSRTSLTPFPRKRTTDIQTAEFQPSSQPPIFSLLSISQ
jgi:hypothetical protein